jgi:excisionase family DNA binding protein
MEAILTMTEERYLTIQEVAARLRQKPRTVRRRIQDGLLRAEIIPGRGKTGMEYRVPESAVDEYLEKFQGKAE